jgi:putative transposase
MEDHVEAVGMVEHDSKIQIPALIWVFVFGFAAGESRTLVAFRCAYNATADKTLSPGGFYQRLTPLSAAYLRDLVEFALDEVAGPAYCQRRVRPVQRRDDSRCNHSAVAPISTRGVLRAP